MESLEIIKIEERIYYNYALLDPRKPGYYRYENYEFFFEPFYIGKGKDRRIKDHFYNYENQDNNFKWNVIEKIREEGLEPISFIIKENLAENDSLENEKYLIKLIGRRNLNKGPLTNLTDGGDGVSGYKHSKESVEKMRQRFLGKKLTEEHKRKISEGNKGIVRSKEYKEKIRQVRLGTKRSKETCDKLSTVFTKYKVLQIDPITEEVIEEWKNAEVVAEFFKCSGTLIRMGCKGKMEIVKGYKWKYKKIC